MAKVNLLAPDETVLDRIQLKRPVLNESHLAAIDQEHFKLTYLSTVYEGDLEDALEALGRSSECCKARRSNSSVR